MPDDRPLSKDLPVGSVLRHHGGPVVTLNARAETEWGATYWVVSPRAVGFVRDDDIDAPDSPWSILPAATCSHGKTVDEYCKWCFYDDVMPDDNPCTHGPMCQWCKPTGPRAERQPIVPALPSDEEAEQLDQCPDCGSILELKDGVWECTNVACYTGGAGERRRQAAIRAIEDDQAQRPGVDALRARWDRHGPATCFGDVLDYCAPLLTRVSRLEAVVEVARAASVMWKRWWVTTPDGTVTDPMIEAEMDRLEATLDASVVGPDADGGR